MVQLSYTIYLKQRYEKFKSLKYTIKRKPKLDIIQLQQPVVKVLLL